MQLSVEGDVDETLNQNIPQFCLHVDSIEYN
jgi:hypothetical protein